MESTKQGSKPVVKHKDLGSFEMKQALMKIANAPMNAMNARALRKIIKDVQEKTQNVSDLYREEILKTHFKHDDKGEPVLENGDFVPNDTSDEATANIKKLNEEFGEREVEILDWIRPFMLAEIKGVTPREMDVLEILISDEAGPGVPNLTPIR